MFCELTVFLCFTESNTVCGEGKGHTETIRPSVLSVLVVFKDVVDNGRNGHFFPAARLSSYNTGVTR